MSAPCCRRCCPSATAGALSSSPARPSSSARFELYCSKITEKEEAERKNKLRGGAVFAPEFHGVQVEVGFHTPRLADGGRRSSTAGRRSTGIDPELAHEMAESIFVRPIDWVAEVERAARRRRASWIVDLGPERHRRPA